MRPRSLAPGKRKSWHGLKREFLGPPALLCTYVLLLYSIEPGLFRFSNLASLLYYTSLLVPALLGTLLLLVLGQFDLSVGSVAALSGVVLAACVKAGLALMPSLVLALGTGAIFGTTNWALVSCARIPALVATLITMAASRACSLGISGGDVIGGLPGQLGALTVRSQWFGSPAVFLGLGLVAAVTLTARRHYFILRLYQAGSSRDAAVNAGMSVSVLEAFAFVSAALGAAMVGILQASRTLSASPHNFPDLALECIAACVIGGARVSGGAGSAVGALAGMFLVVLSRNIVNFLEVSVYWRDLGIAIVLLASALLNRAK